MKTLCLIAMSLWALVTSAAAQDHSHHRGNGVPAGEPTDPASPPAAPAPQPDAPQDYAADAYYDPAQMARSREQLHKESGGMGNSMLLVDRLEWRPGPQADGYAWEVEGWVGGDIDRLAFNSEGEGATGGKLEQAEVQIGWSHAIDPWLNLRVGARQDLPSGQRRTHAVVALEGMLPYWFHVEGQAFLSTKGETTARMEVSYDQRITQSLILQPSAEINLSAQDVPALGLGSGVTSAELGLRMRYEVVREFAPYVGINWERKLSQTARYVRAEGGSPHALRFVAGVRLWF
jgi:copper resistance protein B